MKSDDKIMKNIEQLGERYCRECLGNWKEEDLQKNWWEALKFFFSHSFLRGRRDKLSNEYYYFTIKTLEEYFQITNENLDSSYKKVKDQERYFDKGCILKFKRNKNLRRKNSIKHEDFQNEVAEKNQIIKLLITPKKVKVEWGIETYKKKIFLGNEEDVMMVLDVLRFISSDDKKNIYKYLKDTITSSGVEKAYNELIGIRAIADKIATFIIRDVGLINLNSGIVNKDYEKAFPVDTWVNKIARRIGCHNESIEEIKSYFIKKCEETNINPLKFAAGLWVLGFHSLDILLEHLGEIEIKCNNSPNSG